MTVRRLLRQIDRPVRAINTCHLVRHALALMELEDSAMLLISDDGQGINGTISATAILAALERHGAAILDRPVRDVMTTDIVVGRLGDSAAEAEARMTDAGVDHLPVLEDGRLVGVLSLGDVMRDRAARMTADPEGGCAFWDAFIGGA